MMGKAMAEVIMNEQNRQAALVALLSYQRDLGVDLRLSSNGMNRFDEVASDAATQRVRVPRRRQWPRQRKP